MVEASGVNQAEVGIFDKQTYYEQSFYGITINGSIGLDMRLIEQKKANGFDTRSLKTFLIGGCYSPDSIEAMIYFIQQVNPNEQVKLVVTDINKEAFDLITEYPIEAPPI